MSKLKSITQCVQNCLKFQNSQYWFPEVPEIQNLFKNCVVLTEEQSHVFCLCCFYYFFEHFKGKISGFGDAKGCGGNDRRNIKRSGLWFFVENLEKERLEEERKLKEEKNQVEEGKKREKSNQEKERVEGRGRS